MSSIMDFEKNNADLSLDNQGYGSEDFGSDDLRVNDLDFFSEGDWSEINPDSVNDDSTRSSFSTAQSAKTQINQLYHKVKTMHRADEKDLFNILHEALDDVNLAKKNKKIAPDKLQEAQDIFDQVESQLTDDSTLSSDQMDQSDSANTDPHALNPDHQDEDSPASSVDKAKGVATYKSNPEVILHNYFNNDGVKTYDIKDASEVTLYPANPSDEFVVTFDSGLNKFKIETSSNKGTKTYYVDSTSLSKVILASAKVDTSKLTADQRDKVQVGLDEAADTKAKKLDVIKSVVWPEGGISSHVDFNNTNSSHAGGGGSRAQEICVLIDAAAKAGNWIAVSKIIRDNSTHDWNYGWTQYNDEYMNDAVRKVITGIYRASGATSASDPKFMGLLKLIPEDVRYAMRDGVLAHAGEKHESHGEQWDSQATADILDASISSETGEMNSVSRNPQPTA